ncbi:MAG: TolC family protein [Gemmatimonadales bacterium]
MAVWKRSSSMVALAALAATATAAGQTRSLSLEQALSLAAPASEAVGLARIAIERANGDHYRARSGLFPQITGSVGYTRQIKSQFDAVFSDAEPDSAAANAPTSCPAFNGDPTQPVDQRLAALETALECATTVNPFASFSRLPFGRRNTYTLGLSGSQLLFDGGRVFGQMRATDAARESARIGLASAEAQLVLDVAEAYYDATLSDRLVEIARATLAQTDTTLRQTQLRREVGTAPEFDLLRARVARDNQRPVLIQATTSRDLAYIRLKQLLNLPLEESLSLTTTLGDTALASVPTFARLASAGADTAAEHRAGVRQASEAVRAQEGLAAAARAEQFPSVVLTSQYSRLAYPSRGLPGWSEFLTDWNVALGVQIPIFTGGRLKGDRIAAKAAVEEARLRHQQAVELATLDARNSLAQLEAAEASWLASEGTAAQANRAYEIAELRFREGISTQTELLDARIALQQAEVNRAQAARDLQIAKVRVALLPDLPLGAGASSASPIMNGATGSASSSRATQQGQTP